MSVGDEREIGFDSAQQLHSFRSTIAYVNRIYMKPNGRIIRSQFSYDMLRGKIKCLSFSPNDRV